MSGYNGTHLCSNILMIIAPTDKGYMHINITLECKYDGIQSDFYNQHNTQHCMNGG